MATIRRVALDGTSEKGTFSGEFRMNDGLNIFSADNGYGKSLVARSISWCLGLEAMFGLSPNDNARFPYAVKDHAKFEGDEIKVHRSRAQLEMFRSPGDGIRLTRAITGDDPAQVECEIIAEVGGPPKRSFKLMSRYQSFKDESGGLQSFLFEWFGFKKHVLFTSKRTESPLYFENHAPHFIIDQEAGWSTIQSLQVYRYGILEVAPASVESILGAERTLSARRAEQGELTRTYVLKAEADAFVARVNQLLGEMGYGPIFNRKHTIDKTVEAWESLNLSEYLKEQFNYDIEKEAAALEEALANARRQLQAIDSKHADMTAVKKTSQRVLDLKGQRHELSQQLTDLRRQFEEQQVVTESLRHRLKSSRDLLRLKIQGIGRMDEIDCPACSRPFGIADLGLVNQNSGSIQEHVDALLAEESLFERNIEATGIAITQCQARKAQIEEQLQDANRSLKMVNEATGATREHLVKAANDLAESERDLKKNRFVHKRMSDLQYEIRKWSQGAQTVPAQAEDVAAEIRPRLDDLSQGLRTYLAAFGHSAITEKTAGSISVEADDNYEPYVSSASDPRIRRKIRALGSASDHPRLVASYAISLAETALKFRGNHPGFVLLDEPLQQNPDAKHRRHFVETLKRLRAKPTCQVIIFTHLEKPELEELDRADVKITLPDGTNLLRLAKNK
jgi:hypothetical protein